ncbi:error-prone DNA polymerase [Chitiniphilus purpureus]|uniref:Error-prone DNA polymerase n=1 Tax=Chitiniphilus purpureus TaxID=2981137 RepID=A0ABY6DMZ3_9NEIS|nr:error-prone DNA polymerase [Chitiniphilus sp. CD1]UXY15377.1 error-prone DNA polymerase [Chitiniphilus sp. CD1]
MSALDHAGTLPPAEPVPQYAELHCLSNFSFQRGASHAHELVERAQALGYTALALTDECSLAGIVRAHVAAKEAGLKLIVGAEFTLDDGLRLVLLAPDRHGYGDLSELITLGRRQAAKGSYKLGRNDVAMLCGHLLALWLPADVPSVADGGWFAAHFPDRAWIAAELLHGPDDQGRLAQLQWLGAATGLPLVAAGDVHMHVRSRRALQDVLTAIRIGSPVAQCGLQLVGNGERHLRPRARLAALYPAALLAETQRIAARCTFVLDSLRYEYPAELVPAGLTPTGHLAALVEAGLAQRYPAGTPAMVQQLVAHELALIARLRYEAFFLTVEDIVRHARSRGILCQGRGSAANSVVCYALHITEVRPEEGNLLFERFISVERGEPPDIDVDFEHDRREEVIQYIYGKYGRDRAALAATVISYRTKSSLRDVGRALGLAEDQLDRLAKNLSWWDSRDHLFQRMVEAGLDPESRQVRLLVALVGQLRRFPRHLSQHVGGFVISSGPLARLVPIEPAAMDGRTVIQWDKDDLEALGLLKVDVLALGMLSAIRRSLEAVTALRGRPFTLQDIPREDPRVYRMLSRADTIGVFQVESRAQMSMLPRLKPARFYDLVIEVAIVRPGPIQGGMVHPYLQRREGLESVEYPSHAVRSVLERTLGVPIFQEQVMKLAEVAAGFTPGEADQLRRSMASWRQSGKLEQFKDKLRQGMTGRGYTGDFAERIIRQIEGFSEYGFPESHAASFATLVYFSAWLKCHEPGAFLCGLLNSLPMGFYTASQLIQDARRHRVVVLPVDVQHSAWESALQAQGQAEPAVRLGFNRIGSLAASAAGRIVAARPADGFASVADLQRRAGLDRRALDALTAAGALATLAGHRHAAHWQVSGLDVRHDLGTTSDGAAPADLAAPTLGEDLVADYRSMGLTLRAHPLSLLRTRLARERMHSAADIRQRRHGQPGRACGIVVGRQRPGTASGVTFVTLEDETGNVNVIVWRQLADLQRRALLGARLLAVYGVIQREGAVVHLLAQRLVDMTPLLGRLPSESRDFH